MKLITRIGCLVAAMTITGCAAFKAVEAPVIDVVDAVCVQAEKQPEPQWVDFVCTVAGDVPGVVSVFTSRVPVEQAPAFASLHMAKPTPAAK